MNFATLRHPSYLRDSLDWETWRDTFNGGEFYRDHYLIQLSGRETAREFAERKSLTPIPTFAKSAILDVRNNIYQRLVSVSRVGGAMSYQNAIKGLHGGVDGEGSTMDTFIGHDVLTELLVMGKVGVFTDVLAPEGPTLADRQYPPFLTHYRVEDILSYSYAPRGKGGEFQSVLLRDYNQTIEQGSHAGIVLPNGSEEGYRLVWLDSGNVWYQLFDKEGVEVTDGPQLTGLSRVPFTLFDIGDSLMKDVASYQKALLNLASNDIAYAIKSNTPFLTIQRDPFATGDHLKSPESASGASGPSEEVGSGKGRYYGMNEDRPGFIAPPTDPLEASMKLQDRMEESIRSLINLAVQAKAGSRTESAESKKVGQSGLEAGLSFIGMVLSKGERSIAGHWGEYVGAAPAVVKYPDRYTLKSDAERLEESSTMLKLVERLPTQELKRAAAKSIVNTMLDGRATPDEITGIHRKIDSNDYILTDPHVTIAAHKSGLVDDLTASEALGYNSTKVVPQAQEDRAKRIASTLSAQQEVGGQSDLKNPASRGAPELDTNPQSGETEKETE